MNISHGPVDDDDTDDSSSEYGMQNPDLLVLDLPMQENLENFIGPVSSAVEVSREEFSAFYLQLNPTYYGPFGATSDIEGAKCTLY